MNSIQKYIFFRVMRAVLIIVGGLVLLAILAQGLSQTEIILENRQSAFTFFKVVILGAPQIMALLLPMAIFLSTIWALNRLHRDSEIAVAEAAGMTRWQIASPVLRLALLGAILHLSVNLFVQPAAQREMRAQVQEARTELVSTLFRPGQFTSPDENLTVFARDQRGVELVGLQIAERAGQPDGRDYLAQRGRFIEVDGVPSIVMFDGEIHQLDDNGALNVLKFEQSTFDLSPFMTERGAVILKASDRYLPELVFLDPNDYQDVQDRDVLFAEAHLRVTTPLVSIAMALLAILAVTGGNFSRRGYSQRIIWASVGSLLLTIVQLSVQSAAASDSALNIAQWGVPIITIGALSYVIFWRGREIKTSKRKAVTA